MNSGAFEMKYENEYNEMLDELGPVMIGTLEYSASWVLMRCDPVAYRVGYDDFCDTLGWYEEEE